MSQTLTIETIALGNKSDYNVVVGMSHFIKTVEDLHELLVTGSPKIEFGLAFCEASGPRLIRKTGTKIELTAEAVRMATLIGAGHSFVLVLGNVYPMAVLPAIKQMPEVVSLFCATANPVEVIVGESAQGRGILGVIDGGKPMGVEKAADARERHAFLRQIGYKL